MEEYHWPMRDKLLAKGYRVLGEFCCKGSVLPEAWRLVGAHDRVRPNAAELEEARYFAAKVGNKAQRL